LARAARPPLRRGGAAAHAPPPPERAGRAGAPLPPRFRPGLGQSRAAEGLGRPAALARYGRVPGRRLAGAPLPAARRRPALAPRRGHRSVGRAGPGRTWEVAGKNRSSTPGDTRYRLGGCPRTVFGLGPPRHPPPPRRRPPP